MHLHVSSGVLMHVCFVWAQGHVESAVVLYACGLQHAHSYGNLSDYAYELESWCMHKYLACCMAIHPHGDTGKARLRHVRVLALIGFPVGYGSDALCYC